MNGAGESACGVFRRSSTIDRRFGSSRTRGYRSAGINPAEPAIDDDGLGDDATFCDTSAARNKSAGIGHPYY
jgi:hypothetical protein